MCFESGVAFVISGLISFIFSDIYFVVMPVVLG